MQLAAEELQTEPEVWLDYLEDRHGVYGIGFCKIGSIEIDGWLKVSSFVVRPDVLYSDLDFPVPNIAFTPITRDPIYDGTLERQLLTNLRDVFLWHDGVDTKKRRMVKGQPRLGGLKEFQVPGFVRTEKEALALLNHMLNYLFKYAIPPRLLSITRQYPIEHRSRIYLAGASSLRAMQLAETFPVLAHVLYVEPGSAEVAVERVWEARELVQEGAPLKRVARTAGVDMALRKVGPALASSAAHCVSPLNGMPEIIHAFLPQTRSEGRYWFRAIELAGRANNPDYVRWVARHAPDLGDDIDEVENEITNIGDWVAACNRDAERPDGEPAAIDHPFNARMSIRTVRQHSEEWHQAGFGQGGWHYNLLPFTSEPFPEPWIAGAKIGGYEIVPIKDNKELVAEGESMRHCIGGYGFNVVNGHCYIYTIRRKGKSIATLELRRGPNGQVLLGQFTGKANGPPPAEAVKVVEKWLDKADLASLKLLAPPVPPEGHDLGDLGHLFQQLPNNPQDEIPF